MKEKPLKLIISAAAAAFVLLLAAVLPAVFLSRTEAEEEHAPIGFNQRAMLFDLYWTESETCTVQELALSTFTEEELRPSGELIQSLRGSYVFDRGGPAVESAGERFFLLRTPDGDSLRMREYFEQSSGDWNNWFRVYVDVDTLDIYFLYVSCKCMRNAEEYDLRMAESGDANALGLAWEERMNFNLFCPVSGNAGTLSAVYTKDDAAYGYRLKYTYYDTPEIVVDYQIRALPTNLLG